MEASGPNDGPAPLAGLFVTGTDTGVGKTFVTAAVARLLCRQGRDVAVCKPVATGALAGEDGWISEDTRLLAEAAGRPGQWRRITPWAFPEAVAPPVAARWHGVTLTLDEMAAAVRALWQAGSAVLVEGVGGLLCPLTERGTVADLAAALRLPLVVVTRRGLGTLNHTLLTLEAARTRGLRIAGIVVNETARETGPACETNIAELLRLVDVPMLAAVPFQAGGCPWDCSELARVDWWRLCFSLTLPE